MFIDLHALVGFVKCNSFRRKLMSEYMPHFLLLICFLYFYYFAYGLFCISSIPMPLIKKDNEPYSYVFHRFHLMF